MHSIRDTAGRADSIAVITFPCVRSRGGAAFLGIHLVLIIAAAAQKPSPAAVPARPMLSSRLKAELDRQQLAEVEKSAAATTSGICAIT